MRRSLFVVSIVLVFSACGPKRVSCVCYDSQGQKGGYYETQFSPLVGSKKRKETAEAAKESCRIQDQNAKDRGDGYCDYFEK
jgi:hypothetical protein